MDTLDRLLDRLMTSLCGPRCRYCYERTGRSTFNRLGHEWRDHADERPIP